MKTRLCLVRHGETDWNAERRVQGQIDIPLNAKGWTQAAFLARGLAEVSFTALYSSDLQRAMQTAEPSAGILRLPIRSDPALRERHYGLLQSLTAEEARARHPQASLRHAARDSEYAFETGESLTAFEQRIRECLDGLFRRHAGETILVVTHGGVLDIAYRHATGRPLSSRRDFALPNAALNWLEGDADGWSVLLWADSSHLAQALDELSG
ncbi:MAG: histidine phosphatase family protein [Proteobacteria bacterium]|nr:histidine phosphatase family protein [Pseudomonadota bacterium]